VALLCLGVIFCTFFLKKEKNGGQTHALSFQESMNLINLDHYETIIHALE
jgi:hypothetical protein